MSKWSIREPDLSLMDVIVDESGNDIIRVYEKGLAEEIVSAHNARKPKLAILNENWRKAGDCGIENEYGKYIARVGLGVVSEGIPDFWDALIALPDLSRALVMVRDAPRTRQMYNKLDVHIECRDLRQIIEALKKAGIE